MSPVNKPARVAPLPPGKRDPAASRGRIMAAATAEFSEHGFEGARVDRIARRAGANKRMLYHYFGNKEDLYLLVLEQAYDEIRGAERALRLEHLEPVKAMRRLVGFTFDYLIHAPHFARLLMSENLRQARYLKRSARVRQMHGNMIDTIARILRRGARDAVFRPDVDPVQLFISITGASYFYLANIYTLSTILGQDLGAPRALKQRRAHAQDLILGYLRPATGTAPVARDAGPPEPRG